jgi:hypothetical protein
VRAATERIGAAFAALALAMLAVPALAQTAGKAERVRISGDREVPLAMHVVPWIEPAGGLPEAMRQSLLPRVFESDRSLAHDPLNRSLAVLESARREAAEQAQVLEAEKEAAARRKRRRPRGGDEE